MFVLAVIIILSLTMYLFYKVRYIRASLPLEKDLLAAKGNISLGLFIAVFGVNQFFIHQTVIGTTIGFIFLLLGGYNVYGGLRAYQYYVAIALEKKQTFDRIK